MKLKYFLLIFIFSATVISCGIYSFSGVSIGPNVKTFQVDYFPNNAALVNPTLSNDFTMALQDILTNRTRLNMVNEGGDLVYEGEITRYEQTSVAPVESSTGPVASKIRLTMAVKVRFYDNTNEEMNFEREFSNYEDIDGEGLLTGGQEQELVTRLIERITNDIFNASVAQW